MKKTRTRILEDMLISRQRIKSEDSSLKIEDTAEDLKASISCIESNKLKQETSTKGKNIIPTAKEFWESGHYNIEGNKVNFTTRMRLIDLEKCEPNTEYYVSKNVFILRGYNENKEFTQNFGVVNGTNNQTFTTAEDVAYLGVSIDKLYDEYDEEVDKLMICKMSESDKTWEKGYVDKPSMKYKSEVLGVSGDVMLKVQNKNLAYDIIYSNPKIQYYPFARLKYKLTEGRYYIISYDTENNGFLSYINSGSNYGIRKITDVYSQEHDGSQKKWIVQAINSNLHEVNLINRCDATSEIGAGRIYNLMIEEIDATTDEEALNYLPSYYVEHKEQNFIISLKNKTLYKCDKIIRQNGKWYFLIKHKFWNNFDTTYVEPTILSDKKRCRIQIPDNVSNIDIDLNLNEGFCNKLKLLRNGETYKNKEGFTVNRYAANNTANIFAYIEEFSDFKIKEEFRKALAENNFYFILSLKELELELVEDEVLINQLDKILLNLYEYDGVTNFDFDNDVTFEIEVEKDRISILENRLDKVEQNTTSATMLALENEV